jgi:molybdate/tungstate transport system substrate-binding protein
MKLRFAIWLLVIAAAIPVSESAQAADPRTVVDSRIVRVFHADSLRGYIGDLANAFQLAHPKSEMRHEGSGSLDAIRKVTDLHQPCDVIVTADWRLLTTPRAGIENWVIVFAGNSMGIVYSDRSKDGSEISAANWYQILQRAGVRYGHSNPERDPAGYWTLILWKLAERYYGRPGLAAKLEAGCPLSNVRPHNIDLISLIESGELDYYFGYASDARLGNLKFLKLPPEINLSDFARRNEYARVSIEVGNANNRTRIDGAPIAYGISMTTDAPNPAEAIEFIKLMLSPEGQRAAEKNGLAPYGVPLGDDPGNSMPAELKSLIKPIAADHPPASGTEASP